MNYILGVSVDDLEEAFIDGERMVFLDVSREDNRGPDLASLSIHCPVDLPCHSIDPGSDSGIVVFSSTPGDGMAISGAIDLFGRGYANVRFYKGELSHLTKLLKKYERDIRDIMFQAA